MPDYSDLNPAGRLSPTWAADEKARQRTVSRLLGLRSALGEARIPGAPPRRSLDTLLLATWNIREFDSATWGVRLPESYCYIAEIIDHFDLVAVQEIRAVVEALEMLNHLLGPYWQSWSRMSPKVARETRSDWASSTTPVGFASLASLASSCCRR